MPVTPPASSYRLNQPSHAGSTTSSVKSSTSSAHIRAKAEKAALEAEAKAIEEQNAFELEALQVQIETQQRQLKLEQRRREIELKIKYVRADALAKTYAEAEEAGLSEVCFKTPIANPTHQPTPKHPLARDHTPVQSAHPNFTPTPFSILTPAAAPSNQPDMGYLLHQLISDTRVHQQSLVDGDPLKYWPFIRAFQNTVAKETISDGTKLNRLLKYCTGKAKHLLQCCTVKEPSEGYTLALRLLKERYGDDRTYHFTIIGIYLYTQ